MKNWPVFGAIIAGVVFVWVYLRKPAASPAVQYQPSPASSGVPAYMPAVQQYTVTAPQISPSPEVVRQSSNNPCAFSTIDNIRQCRPDLFGGDYQSYNVPPAGDLSKHPKVAAKKKTGCGCQSSCKGTCPDNNAQFTDGQGNGCLVTTKSKLESDLEAKYPGLWEKYAGQFAASGLDQNGNLDIAVHQNIQLAEKQESTPPVLPHVWSSRFIGGKQVWS